ncbi:MAG: hypothetical protein IPN34_12030 [Planctomycetes bacterium]|nr:hypothetical protein [Planctomycetota bacterium]
MSLVPRPSSALVLALALGASATALRAQLDHESAPTGGTPSIRLPEGQQRPQPEGLNVIYDNGPYVNQPGGGTGGADASVLQTSTLLHGILGFGGSSATVRLADDFTVPGGQLWYVESVKVYAYRTNSATSFVFDTGALQVWDGNPGSGTANVIFGDPLTNRLISSTWDNAYRVTETTLTATNRPVVVSELRVGKVFSPGTYWIDFWVNTATAGGSFTPPITITGQNVTGDALQFLGSNTPPTPQWNPLLMTVSTVPTHPTGIPFQLCGTVACCWEAELGRDLNHGDDSITDNLALGFNFLLPGQLPGGTTTPVVSVCSNGFVGLGGAFTADFTPTVSEFSSQGERIAVPWDDYVPSAGFAPRRQVFFNALPGRAVVTWRRVPTFGGGPSLSMVQLQMFPSGSFFINVWQHEPVTPRTPIFGVSAGNNALSQAIDMSIGYSGIPGIATIYESFASGASDLSGKIFAFDPASTSFGVSYRISVSDACCNDAARVTYGAGCANLGVTSTLPLAGLPITFSITGVAPTAAAAVLTFGVTQTSLAIDPILAPGCELLTGLEFPGALPLDPQNPNLTVLIPCNAKFFGQTLYLQAFAIDPAANALGLAASNGLCITIGND